MGSMKTTQVKTDTVALEYGAFLRLKTSSEKGNGLRIDPDDLPDAMYPFQRSLTAWALEHSRAAIFADCGLGKTIMQLVWGDKVHRHTGKPVLVLTPLAVSAQTEGEAQKFGFDAVVSRTGKPTAPITVTNYDRLHLFDPADYGGCVADESSIIKSFDGVMRQALTAFVREMEFRLLCTATAAPNDYTELGTSSEALGHLGHMDMLSRFFVNDQNTSKPTVYRHRGANFAQLDERARWRFKGHAEQAFWRWVSSWARALRKPSDLGFSDEGFDLPELTHRVNAIEARSAPDGSLFNLPAVGLTEEREEQRRTVHERCEKAAELLGGKEPGVAWCQLNAEGDLLTRLIPGAVQVKGGDHPDKKEEALRAFGKGEIRCLVTKPKIGAWGLNWQHCNRMTFFPSHSYEQYYQAVRRCWRFGQKRPVTVDIVTTEGGANALANLQRKSAAADKMFESLVAHMKDAQHISGVKYENKTEVPTWL